MNIPATWTFVPLRGKVPTVAGWQLGKGMSYDAACKAAKNIGLRTGTNSGGVIVIDVDTAKGGQVPDNLPPTVTVETGGGGVHLYFALASGKVGNTVGSLAPGVDIRGDGGQVVFPGSVHPDTGRVYAWRVEHSPDDLPLAPLPEWIIDALARPKLSRYAQAALDRELSALRQTGEGQRNDALNRAAYNLAQLSAGGALPADSTIAELRKAALSIGLGQGETDRTIESAWRSGTEKPRDATTHKRSASAPTSTVLIPGEHIEANGEVIEQGTDDFAVAILRALPPGALYRWERIVGEVVGPPGAKVFRELTADRMRLIVDFHCRLARWRMSKEGKPRLLYCSCTKDLAGLVLAAATTAKQCRELQMLTHFPVYGAGFRRAAPGWNAETGILYDEPPDLAGIGPAPVDLDLLADLMVDFPFRDDASRINLLGLMLTPLLRPAVGPVPIHLVQSSIERTGKGLLISAIIGQGILGAHIPSVQLGEREEEREKRITGLILEGATVVHLDNLPGGSQLDSPSLAALATATVWKGRTLGASAMPSLPNTLTIVASANNLRASAEVAKRIVPIWLEPDTDSPETRSDFTHPDIHAYARSQRRSVLAVLLGMVEAWIVAGRAPGTARLGGFEVWAASVGGILACQGVAGDWMGNRAAWTSEADEWTPQARAMVAEWEAQWGESVAVSAKDLSAMAHRLDLFPDIFSRPEIGWTRAFGVKVLSRMCNRPFGSIKVRKSPGRIAGYYLQR